MKVVLQQHSRLPGRYAILLLLAYLAAGIPLAYAAGTGTFQAKEVTGKVIDETGAGIPGATVIEKGTTNATTTNADGVYKINVSSNNATLVFSFIGYSNEEREVGSLSVVDITLTPSIETLSEVVVVGYGTQKKSDITGSLVSVSSDALKEVPVANLQNGLQGRAAGVEVQKTGSTPGASAQIRIRGERSISGSNDPLIILDGIPYQGTNVMSDINPSDIASMEVLKDASATAIYGSRGANGVILITTKRGKKGDNTVSFNTYYGIATVAKKYQVYDAQGYRNLRDRSVWTGGYQADELASIQNGRSTDWQDLMYDHGYITDNNVTVSGGGEKSTYSFGGGFFKEKAVLPGQDYSRGTIRFANDAELGKRVRVGFSSMNTYSIRNGSTINPMFQILALSPLMPAYNDDGSINKTPAGNDDDKASVYSPLLLKHNDNNWVDRIRRIHTFNSAYGEIQLAKGLKYRVNVGLDYTQEENDQFRGADSYFTVHAGNWASVQNTEEWSYTLENLLTYDTKINEMHVIKFTGLFSTQQDQMHSNYVRKDSLTGDFLNYFNLGASSATSAVRLLGNETKWGLLSYMARVNYAFNDKYLLTLTARLDGSSRLSQKWLAYPAASAGWNIDREEFMSNIRPVSSLKLRVGWGNTANQAVAPYSLLGGVTNTWLNGGNTVNTIYNFGSNLQAGYYFNRIASKDLKWESTATTNIGLDFGLLEDRITGSIDWYDARTKNIIYDRSLPATTGVPSPYSTNIGKMQNTGFEISVSSVNVKSPSGFEWRSDLNLFWNRNKLLYLDDGFKMNIAAGLFIGQPLTAIYDYQKLGIWQTSEAQQAATFGQVPGQLKIADISGPDGVPDGKITTDDRKIIGSGQAKIQGGITNRFAFKGFDLSFVTYARFGGTIISGIHQPLAGYLTINDGRRNQLKTDYWTPENPTNAFPAPLAVITPPNAGTAWTTLGYYSASFVRIRSINLGYKIPSSIADRLRVKSLRVYTTIQNPWIIWSPYVKAGGIDPEATGFGTTMNGFVQNGGNIPDRALTVGLSTPPSRSYILGLNITF